MGSKMFEFDISDFDRYFKFISKAAHGEFKKQIALWFEACGFEFLVYVQDEIIRRGAMDTRELLHSFQKGKPFNVWESSQGGLYLEVGTNLEYAVKRMPSSVEIHL